MFKSKLQEVCQKKAWPLPEYKSTKEGLDHNPRFSASVTVNGLTFNTAQSFNSSKLAQNDAARIAFDHLSNPPPPPVHFAAAPPSVFRDHLSNPPPPPVHFAAAPPSVFRPVPSSFPQPSLIAGLSTGRGAEWSCVHTPQKLQEPQKTDQASQVIDNGTVCGSQITGSTFQQKLQEHTPQKLQEPQKTDQASQVIDNGTVCGSQITGSTFQQKLQEHTPQKLQEPQKTDQASQVIDNGTVCGSQITGRTLTVESHNRSTDVQHLHKNQLQYYAQKRNLILPVYSCEREGPPHAARFKCSVTIDGRTYQGQEFLPTLKDAEHAAAKIALISLMPNGVQEDDSGLYKNLLQEILQKEGQHVPLYSTATSGEPHMRSFVSTVEIGGEYFTGQVARSKKLAEVSAAKVAYNTLRDRKSSQVPLFLTPGLQGQEGSNFISSNVPPAVAIDLQQQERPKAPKISVPYSVTGERQSEINVTAVGINPLPTIPSSGGSTSLKTSRSASPATQNASDGTSDMTLEPPAKRMYSKKCTVYSQTMTPPTLPEGCTVLPITDENWVAVMHEVKKVE